MDWADSILDELAGEAHWGYRPGAPASTEPTALAALALAGHGRTDEARLARAWLLKVQTAAGSLGIDMTDHAPHWATAIAVLAWRAVGKAGQPEAEPYEQPIRRAVDWILSIEGQATPRDPELGHDTTLVGWPWVEGTHSWIEPTAYCVLALKATGHGEHPRVREAVRLLIDRMLPDGGCNYGNTYVLGQMLRPHLDPTGLTLMALAGEKDPSGKLERTLDWAAKTVGAETTTLSLAMAVLGLTAHDRRPKAADAWLARSAEKSKLPTARQPWKTLLVLAAQGTECPLIRLPRATA
jgi:hypothetical protein